MQIVFDLSTSKDVLFFKPMIDKLQRWGHNVSAVSRSYWECNEFIKHYKIDARILGKHGGASLKGKLKASGQRLYYLAEYLDRLKPDVIVCLANPESCRAGFGLKIPVVCFNDMPEADAVCRLTTPLASKIMTPWIVPKDAFTRHGIDESRVYQYHALDPVLWLKDKVFSDSVIKLLRLDPSKPIIVWRESEVQAAYFEGVPELVSKVVKALDKRHPPPHNLQIVKIGRYEPRPTLDVQSLLMCATLFIGGGGTMSVEASYFGTPVLDCRAIPTRYMDFLCEKGLSRKAASVEEGVRIAEELLKKGERNIDAVREVYGPMRFPLEDVLNEILNTK